MLFGLFMVAGVRSSGLWVCGGGDGVFSANVGFLGSLGAFWVRF